MHETSPDVVEPVLPSNQANSPSSSPPDGDSSVATTNSERKVDSAEARNDEVDAFTSSAEDIREPRDESDAPASTTEWLVWNFVAPLAVIACAVAAVIALGTVEPEKRAPADTSYAGRMKALTPVRVSKTTTLESLERQLELRVDGTVVPFREVRIATEVAGRIVFKSDKCEAGSFAQKDDLLMRIDPTDYELEVERLTRLQEQEYQALGEVDQEMANTKRLVEVAKQDEALQDQEVNRLKSLPDGFASKGEVDKASRTLLQARQQTVAYENQLELLKKRRTRLEASERLAATQLAAAKVNLQRTEIRSPINGVIIKEDAELNTFVGRGSTIVTIEDTSKAEVATSLRMDQLYWVLDQQHPETKAQNSVGFGQASYDIPETPAIVEFTISGREDKTYQWDAKLLRYDGIGVDGATRTVPVRIVVDRPREYTLKGSTDQSSGPTTLVRGMFVNVRLLINPKTPLVVIPAEALKPGNRVWQFIADDSAFNDQADPTTDESESSADSVPRELAIKDDADMKRGVQLSENNSEIEFAPERWQAGRVVIREDVFPVDSLTLASQDSSESDDNQSPGDLVGSSDRQWWVCEVRGQVIRGDSWVVVSPVSSSDTGEIKARIRKPELYDSQNEAAGDESTTIASEAEA